MIATPTPFAAELAADRQRELRRSARRQRPA
jgi:hypothetical protein